MPHDDKDCPLYEAIESKFQEMVAAYRSAYADGKLEFNEVISMVTRASVGIGSIIKTMDLSSRSDEEVRDCILHCLGEFYDKVVAPIDIKAIPNLFEGFVDRTLREGILTFMGPVVLRILQMIPDSPTLPDDVTPDDDDAEPSPHVIGAAQCTKPEV